MTDQLPAPRAKSRKARRSCAIGAAVLLGCGLSVSAVAQSTGFSLTGRVSERLDITEGNTLSNTGFGINASSSTRRSTLDLGAGFSLLTQTRGGGNLNLVNPNFSVGYRLTGKRVSLNTSAALTVQPIQYTDVDDNLNLVQRDGLRQTLSGSVGINYALTQRTNTSLSFTLSDTDFDDAAATLVPSQTRGVRFSLNHNLTQSVSVGANVGYSLYTADDAADTESRSTNIGVNLSYQPTQDLSLSLNASAARTETERTAAGGRATVTNENILLGGSLSYSANSDTTLTASLSQSVSPSSLGTLTQNTIARVGMNYEIDSDSSIDFQLTGARRDSLGGANQSETVQFSTNYRRQIWRQTNAQIGYAARKVTGQDVEHRLLLQVSKSFDLLP